MYAHTRLMACGRLSHLCGCMAAMLDSISDQRTFLFVRQSTEPNVLYQDDDEYKKDSHQTERVLQGYLAHKKTTPPEDHQRALGIALL